MNKGALERTGHRENLNYQPTAGPGQPRRNRVQRPLFSPELNSKYLGERIKNDFEVLAVNILQIYSMVILIEYFPAPFLLIDTI